MNEVIIIGAGPAGVSLALYLKRDNHNVTVITNNNSMLLKAGTIENYYGFKSISGKDLYEKGIDQLNSLGIEVIEEEVVGIEKLENFKVTMTNRVLESKVLVLATGALRTPSRIPNASLYEGKGLSYCATCDGFFFKNKNIGVIGTGNLAYQEAKHLSQLSPNVTLFTNNEKLKRDFTDLNIKICTNKIIEIKGTDKVEGLLLDNEEIYGVSGIFMALGVAGSLSFSKTLGIETVNSFIKVDSECMTNIEGLYAIGDIIGGVLQIGKAVSDGIIASKAISKKLNEKS